jgi:hypothetical protein
MGSEPPEPRPIEQLLEVLVYAPVGLIYEYQEVLPRLVKRGKSQVQLARLLSQMAASRARSAAGDPAGTAEPSLAEMAGVAWSLLARAITEVGASVGLAPEAQAPAGEAPAGEAPAGEPLPIDGYDQLTARDIIRMVGELPAGDRDRIRAYEQADRARKTVLAKLDRLDADPG